MTYVNKRILKIVIKNPKANAVDYYLSLRYQTILTPEEDGWSAAIPELPGCIAAGDTSEDVLLMIEDARRSWIEASIQRGLPIPEPHAYFPTPG